MNKKIFVLLVLVLVAVAVLAYNKQFIKATADNPDISKTTPTKQLDRPDTPNPITARSIISAPGRVEAISEEIKVSAEVSGLLKEVLVEEGDVVKKNQVIARLNSEDLVAAIASVKVQIGIRKTELDRLLNGSRPEEKSLAQAEVQRAEIRLKKIISESQRRQDLYKTGDISKEEKDSFEREVEIAQAEYEVTKQKQLLINDESRKEDITRARQAITLVEAQIKELQAKLNKTIVVSPIDGVVLRKHLKTGENVSVVANTPIITMADTSTLRLRVDIDEVDVGKVFLGQKAYFTAEAYPNKKFLGKVSRINLIMGKKNIRTDEPTERIDKKVLEVLLEFDEKYDLPLGLRVDTSLIIGNPPVKS